MAKRRRGHPTVFSPEQNRALRNALKSLSTSYPSQSALGEALGIEQQNAGRLMKDRRAGFSYSTASSVAQLSGFAGVDAFFSAKGVAQADSTTVLAENASIHSRQAS